MARIACIDIGTVSCRLAVADVANRKVTRCVKQTNICNLGEGVDATGQLKASAQARVLQCVELYLNLALSAGADAVVCTLTSAARDAKNANEFLFKLENIGVIPEVIGGDVEAQLTFLGVAQDFVDQTICVADNGGGSTEVAIGKLDGSGKLTMDWVHSFNIGCRRLTDKFLHQAPPEKSAVKKAYDFSYQTFDELLDSKLKDNPLEALVCTGGTVTSLVALAYNVVPYNPSVVHLHPLTRSDVQTLQDELGAKTLEQLSELPALQPQRASVIEGGTIAVAALMDALQCDELIVSESDLLFGLAIVCDEVYTNRDSVLEWIPRLKRLK